MADLTTLLSKFLTSLYAGTLYNNPLGGTSVGMPVIRATGRSVAAVAAVASVTAFTVGAADGSFEVFGNVNVTTATNHNFTVTVAYTDETNASRTTTLLALLGATSQNASSNQITNTTAAGVYILSLQGGSIRAKAATPITVATTGTFTTVTYNVEAFIQQIA